MRVANVCFSGQWCLCYTILLYCTKNSLDWYAVVTKTHAELSMYNYMVFNLVQKACNHECVAEKDRCTSRAFQWLVIADKHKPENLNCT